jgi:hexosaminidase
MRRKNIWVIGVLFSIWVFWCCGLAAASAENQALSIIPWPGKSAVLSGTFEFRPETIIVISRSNQEIAELARYLVEKIKEATGLTLEINENLLPERLTSSLALSLVDSRTDLSDEGYSLKISPQSVLISAPKPAGLFYGIQTIRQFLSESRSIPCAEVEDKPRFAWRGMLLDCGRHFMTADFVKRYIDLLAYHKMNVFHWHLTEDQGWRLEVKRYPRLTEIGAWRTENEKRYGGFYTQEEVREIVAYARSRYVTVVPEIEMPGHSLATLAAYPELSCTGKPVAVESSWGVFNDVLCPGKEKTFEFVQNTLDEVCELFPSPSIHIGGDECPKHYWKKCPDCQKRIKEEGLRDEDELQGYFTRRVEQYLQGKGRQIIGWDEILEGGVSRTAIVQSWRGLAGAVAAARQGNRVISSPWDGTYLICPQVNEERRAGYRTLNSLEAAYAFNPVPAELTPDQAAFVMGGECCMWNEYTQQFEVDPQVFPRLCAIAEVLWSEGTKQSFADFLSRLEKHYPRLGALGVDYHRPEILIGRWREGEVTSLSAQLWWDVTPHIKEPGIYRFSFIQNQTHSEILLKWVALFEDDREISRFTQLNRSQSDIYLKYPLRITQVKPGAVYTIRASVVGSNDSADSAGSIWLRYFKDNGIDLWQK